MQSIVFFAVIMMVVLATRLTGLPVRKYLGLVSLNMRDILRGIGYGVVGYVGLLALLALFFVLAPLTTPETSSITPITMAPLGGIEKRFAILAVLISGIVAGHREHPRDC